MHTLAPSLYNMMIGAYPKVPRENEELYSNFGTPKSPHVMHEDSEDATVRKKHYLYSV